MFTLVSGRKVRIAPNFSTLIVATATRRKYGFKKAKPPKAHPAAEIYPQVADSPAQARLAFKAAAPTPHKGNAAEQEKPQLTQQSTKLPFESEFQSLSNPFYVN